MNQMVSQGFVLADFLNRVGLSRKVVQLDPRQVFFSQGDAADSVFFLQRGRARVTAVSAAGKEATLRLLQVGDFVGEEALASIAGHRLTTATAVTNCIALRIRRDEMIRIMHAEQAFSDYFFRYLLARSMRTQADLIDQLFNSSEKRLARVLLMMAEIVETDKPETMIPKISQETLAEMIGTTRSRVSFFMNRFRKLGFIRYNGHISVRKSLLNVILHDHVSDGVSKTPKPGKPLPPPPRAQERSNKSIYPPPNRDDPCICFASQYSEFSGVTDPARLAIRWAYDS